MFEGLSELTNNMDDKGKKVNNFFLPMSLRGEDSSVEKSNDMATIEHRETGVFVCPKYDGKGV